jgi:hypothetical protein
MLEARLTQIDEERRRCKAADRKRLLIMVLTFVLGIPLLAGGTVGVLWVMGNFVSRRTVALIGAVLATWAVLIYAGYQSMELATRTGKPEEASLKAAFDERVLLPVLREALPRCRVSAEPLIDLAGLKASRLFHSHHNRMASTCGFAGEAGGCAFRASVVRLAYRQFGKPLYPGVGPVGETRSHQRRGFGFSGILVHLERRGPFAVTVRLVDPVYQNSPYGFETRRAHDVVLVKSGDAAFDEAFMVVLDQGQTAAPPIPEALRRVCCELRERFDLPVFVSFTDTGTYLAVATGDGRLPMQVENLIEPEAETLAKELEVIRKVPAAVEALSRALEAG